MRTFYAVLHGIVFYPLAIIAGLLIIPGLLIALLAFFVDRLLYELGEGRI